MKFIQTLVPSILCYLCVSEVHPETQRNREGAIRNRRDETRARGGEPCKNANIQQVIAGTVGGVQQIAAIMHATLKCHLASPVNPPLAGRNIEISIRHERRKHFSSLT